MVSSNLYGVWAMFFNVKHKILFFILVDFKLFLQTLGHLLIFVGSARSVLVTPLKKVSDGVVGWGAHRLGLMSILGHDPHEIGFTCTFYCPLYMVWKDPSFLFQGQVMEQCYPQLARSTGHHHHSYWTILLILVAVL